MAVPAAAPLAPHPNVKIKRGSRIAFPAAKASDHLRGVSVSPRPRNNPFETSQRHAVGVPSARTVRYESAEGCIEEDGGTPRKERIWAAKSV